ncbi:MAG: glycosyltransferase family 2 protein [Treponema sp.]|nr:glycosyltransferase family 2 protein [Treponema sp.]
MKLLITVPTYNEAPNIESFIKAVFEHIPDGADLLVIDDNSPDGTAALVQAMIPQFGQRLHILNRPEKQGLAQAYLAAFGWGLSRDYDVFLEMDADFSHNPVYIPEMFRQIQTYDVVIGSRNIKGGGVEGWPFLRNLISKGGSVYSRVILGCPIRDLTGGFNMWRKSALEKIGLENIISRGYSFQIEMKYRAFCSGCSVKEIPIVFVDRKLGNSKMSKKIFIEALLNVWKIKKSVDRDSGIDQFVKFAVTGGLGAITNLVIFFLLADKLNLPSIPVSIVCFLIAVTQNYIINQKWSFRQNTENNKLSIKRWCVFTGSSLFGLAVNLIVMTLMLTYLRLPYKFIAQLAGILAGMIINFIFSKKIVFKGKKDK